MLKSDVRNRVTREGSTRHKHPQARGSEDNRTAKEAGVSTDHGCTTAEDPGPAAYSTLRGRDGGNVIPLPDPGGSK